MGSALRTPWRAAPAALLLVASLAAAAPPPPIVVDPLPLRALLAEEDFEALEARFAAVRALALEPSEPEHRELHAFAVRALENPAAARRRLARHPVQEWIERHRRWLYLHAFESALGAALVLLAWYVLRARRRRKAAGPVPVLQLPLAPSPIGVAPSMLERLPRGAVQLLRAFLWFEAVRLGLYYDGRLVPADPQPLLLVEIAASAVALAGALAFAYGLRLGRPWLWKLWAVGYPAWTQWLAVGPHGFTWEQWSIWGFWHAILLPVYASLFLYGWSCDGLWRGGLPGPGWRAPRRARPAGAAAGRGGG
jgi:hypothetical protein